MDIALITVEPDAPQPAPVPPPRLSPCLAFLALVIAPYLLALGLLDLLGIYEILVDDFAWAVHFGLKLPTAADTAADFRIALLSMIGASLGACLVSFLGLFEHAVVRADFSGRYFGAYLFGPLAVIFLGFCTFILVRGGLFAFGSVDSIKITLTSELSFLAFAILVGFSWNHVLAKVAEIAGQLFATKKPAIATSLPSKTGNSLGGKAGPDGT